MQGLHLVPGTEIMQPLYQHPQHHHHHPHHHHLSKVQLALYLSPTGKQACQVNAVGG